LALDERKATAADHLTELAAERAEMQGLVLFPDEISVVGGEEVGGFRPEAQALRVEAMREGIEVELALPDGVRPGIYSEHAADWVLPVVLEIPNSIVAGLIATHLQRRLDAWRSSRSSNVPTVRYRDLERQTAEGATTRIREIEGPAPEVIEWLRSGAGRIPISPSSPEQEIRPDD
jgi:hypothetical protein